MVVPTFYPVTSFLFSVFDVLTTDTFYIGNLGPGLVGNFRCVFDAFSSPLGRHLFASAFGEAIALIKIEAEN